jgi:FAD/FMN-containing dehydrogenase
MSALRIRRRSNGETTVGEAALKTFEARLRGRLIRPVDPGYDEARRVNNGMHDHRPAAIVRAAGVADVMAAVKLAREHDAVLAVRGGGHSVAGFGTCGGGLVLDLGGMRGIRVDAEGRTVRAEGGCTWGDLNHATHAFGLATTGGIVSTTGIAGLTLGGGVGYLSRTCGLSCDNLLSADVVMADGSFVICSEDREPDLFWALRGGGGNFGVVTSFEYRLQPVAEIFGGPTFFPLDGDVLRAYREFIVKAPEQLGAVFGITLASPLPFLPEEWHRKPVSAVIACWTGSAEEGARILEPLKGWGRIVGAQVGPMPYPALNTLFDELLPAGLQQYWKGNLMRAISDDVVEIHVAHGARAPSLESSTLIYPVDGACHRIAPERTAYAGRDATFSTVIAGAWPDPAENERNIRWVREYHDALRPHAEEVGYVNTMAGDDQGRVRAAYGDRYARLAGIKSRVDPSNLFRLNQNIQPSPSA